MNLISLIGNIFTPAANLVDNLHTSEEEKLQVRNELFKLQAELFTNVQDYETKILESKASIINSEANSQSTLARNWRPITMLMFVFAVMTHWFGLTPDDLSIEAVEDMFTLVQIGLGGYDVGRSVEKTAKSVAGIIQNK